MNSIYNGNWNVLALLKPGKMKELAEKIANTQLEIGAVQETRWSGNGLIKKNNYSLHYSGSNKTGQAGTSFTVMKKALKFFLGFETYNEQICKLRIKGKCNSLMYVHLQKTKQKKIKNSFMKIYNL
jgi:hypothetical protein